MNIKILKRASQLGADQFGSIAIMAGLLLPLLVATMGFAVDYTLAARDRSQLQTASDTTALALARELSVARPSTARIQAIGEEIAHEELKRRKLDDGATVAAVIQDAKSSVKVDIRRPRRGFFMRFLGQAPGDVAASSVASLAGRRKICVVTLDPSSSAAMELKASSWLTTEGCDVFANSTSSSAIKTEGGIRIESSLICSAGGISGAGDLRGERLTDCPPVPDPLASRPAPVEGPCIANGKDLIDKGTSAANRAILSPGTYCGGLKVRGKSFVTFLPGVYIVKDGEFAIDDDADVIGDHVGFYLMGEKSHLKFKGISRIWFNAPKDGLMAGLLFFEDRSVAKNRKHEVSSNFVYNMTGTIYLSRGQLVVDASYDVAQQSAFTLIVVNQLLMDTSPRLVVNSDYGLTDVPVPAGLGLVNGPVRLTN